MSTDEAINRTHAAVERRLDREKRWWTRHDSVFTGRVRCHPDLGMGYVVCSLNYRVDRRYTCRFIYTGTPHHTAMVVKPVTRNGCTITGTVG